MNAEAILSKIEKDARDTSAQILRDAHARAEAVRAASEQKIQRERTAAMEQARRDALEADDRTRRMAKLEARKATLYAQRQVLDEAFAAALSRIQAMPRDKAKAFGLAVLLAEAKGDEVLVADAKSAWCDTLFVSEANAALIKSGRLGNITLAKETQALSGGFLLRSAGREINCSYPSALESMRMDLEAEAAALLFGSREGV